MKRRSGFTVMARLIGLVKPLTGFMLLAILMGLIGHLCAAFITIFGGYAVLEALRFDTPFTLAALFVCVVVFAIIRGFLRYAEQACNHSSPSSCWRFCGIRCSGHCAGSALPSLKAGTRET